VGTLWRERPVPRPFVYIFLRVPNKQDLLIIQYHISLEVPGKAAASPWPLTGQRCPFLEPSLTYSSGHPVKYPFIQVPLAEFPWETGPPFPEPCFILFSEAPVNEPNRTLWKKLPFPEPPFIYLLESPINKVS
jgi:hypothetical protein